MILPQDIGRLTQALRFRPGPIDTLGMRIAIAARLPDRYEQPSVFLEATLHDLTPEAHKNRYPTYRFVVDETSLDNEPMQRLLADTHKRREETFRGYDDGDPVKELVRQSMATPPQVWLTFGDSDWAVIMGDRVTAHTYESCYEPLGQVFQLNVLKTP